MYFRSPWTNSYEPPLEDGAMPSERLRKLEIEANTAFDQYRELYFEGGVSSVYLWDLDAGFAGVILIKKAGDGSKKIKGKFHDALFFTDFGHTKAKSLILCGPNKYLGCGYKGLVFLSKWKTWTKDSQYQNGC